MRGIPNSQQYSEGNQHPIVSSETSHTSSNAPEGQANSQHHLTVEIVCQDSGQDPSCWVHIIENGSSQDLIFVAFASVMGPRAGAEEV